MSQAQLKEALNAWPRVEPALRVPHSEHDYQQLVKLLDQLTDEVGEDEDRALASFMEILGVLIESMKMSMCLS